MQRRHIIIKKDIRDPRDTTEVIYRIKEKSRKNQGRV